MHYVEDACAKQFHPKTNPYKFKYDEDIGQFKCRYALRNGSLYLQVKC